MPLLHRYPKAHAQDVTSLCITKTSDFIVSGSNDMKVKVWTLNPINKQLFLVHEFKGLHMGQITQVFLTEDDYLITGSVDNSICLIDLRDKKGIHKFTEVHGNNLPFSSSVTIHSQQGSEANFILSGSSGEGELALIKVDPTYISIGKGHEPRKRETICHG